MSHHHRRYNYNRLGSGEGLRRDIRRRRIIIVLMLLGGAALVALLVFLSLAK
jgi:hypothetical protein